MHNILSFILLQKRYYDSVPGEEIMGLLILAVVGAIVVIFGIIKFSIEQVRESFKVYTPEELKEKENLRIVWHNQRIREKYAEELKPMDIKVRSLREKVAEEKSENKKKELSEQLLIAETEYLHLLISKGHRLPIK